MSDMRIAVMGAAGRMGRELVRAVHAMPGCVVAGGTEVAGLVRYRHVILACLRASGRSASR